MTGANPQKSNKDPSAKKSTTGVVYAQISKFASQYHKDGPFTVTAFY